MFLREFTNFFFAFLCFIEHWNISIAFFKKSCILFEDNAPPPFLADKSNIFF